MIAFFQVWNKNLFKKYIYNKIIMEIKRTWASLQQATVESSLNCHTRSFEHNKTRKVQTIFPEPAKLLQSNQPDKPNHGRQKKND